MYDYKTVAENIVRHDNGNYYLRAKIAGNKILKSLRTDSLKIAKLKRDNMLRKLRMQYGKSKDSRKMTFAELVALTRVSYRSRQIKESTKDYYDELLKVFESVLPLTRAVSSFTEKETAQIFIDLAKHYSAQRYNNKLSMFRDMMEIAIKSSARMDDPSADIKKRKIPKSLYTPPSREEFRKAVDSIRIQNSANSQQSANFVEFLAYSGARINEVVNILGRDIEKDRIKITGGETGTKNHEIRFVPILTAMRELLDRMHIEDDKPIFTIKSPRGALRNAYKRTGTDQKKIIHGLKHLFVTTCVESGVDAPTVAKWAAHKDGGKLVFEIYNHVRDEHSQREAAKVVF